MERMREEKLTERSDAQKVEGKGRGRRLRMRWEDCVKRDLERMGGEWRTTVKGESCKLLIENVMRESEERKHETKDDGNRGQHHP